MRSKGSSVVKRAVVRQRRTLGDGRRLVNVVCPFCEGRHWLPASATGSCPRRSTPAAFTIADTPKKAAR
jgi:hypothetical protein